MKELTIKFFQCEFCGGVETDADYIKQHEENCCLNPSSRSCQTCIQGYLGFGREDVPVAKCKTNNAVQEVQNCPDWIEDKVKPEILSEYLANNGQSLCTYVKFKPE